MKVIAFNTGLEQVLTGEPLRQNDFPQDGKLLPLGQSPDSHTQRLFDAKTAEQQLENFVRPVVLSPEILDPGVFNTYYTRTMSAIDKAKAETEETSATLDNVQSLLTDNVSNIHLLHLYRQLLVPA